MRFYFLMFICFCKYAFYVQIKYELRLQSNNIGVLFFAKRIHASAFQFKI